MDEGKINLDRMRSRGGRADIGLPEEGGIDLMINVTDRLLIVKQKAVYEFIDADSLDPERQYPGLPLITQRKILDIGSTSEMFCRTFLQAYVLLKKQYLQPHIDIDKAMEAVLSMLIELSAMQQEIDDLKGLEVSADQEYEQRRVANLDHKLPSIPDLRTRCKTILQKAHHVIQFMVDFFKIGYPDYNYGLFKNMPDFISTKYPEDTALIKFINTVTPFMELIRVLRNCLDHRNSELKILDFELQMNGNILSPTIELAEHQGASMIKMHLMTCLGTFVENFEYIFEHLVGILCNKNLLSGMLVSGVAEVPIEKRHNKLVKFGYLMPLGPEGCYKQL